MSEPFLGEIRVFSMNFVPRGWAACDGQFLPINQNQALFALLGTQFGGNGQTTFALPDLRSKVPMHIFTSGQAPGTAGGESAHTLTAAELPAHAHAAMATNTKGDQFLPTGNVLASVAANLYAQLGPGQALPAASIGNTGLGQPHENRSPYLTLTFGIALQGIFPTQN